MSGSLTSPVTAITVLDNVAYQLDFSGSPVGYFQVELSSNYNQDELGNVLNPGTWVPVIFTYFNGTIFVTSSHIPTSSGSPIIIEITQTACPFARVVYTSTSGSGTLNAIVSAKMV